MADRLTVQVKLDTTQAKKNLADLISQMKKAEESGAKFKKSLSTSANVVGDLTKVDKAISGISRESDRAESSMKKLKGSADTLGNSFEKVGSKFAKAFGSNLQSSLSKSIGFMKQLASTALMVGGAVSGVSAYKTFNDYTEFSKKAGSINAIVGGDASTQRLIENTMLGATAGTTQKSGDVGDALLSFASTPMFDPSAGGTIEKGSAEFKKNIAALGPIAQKVGAFASSQGTSLKTVMDGMILLSASEGFNLKDNKKGGDLDKAMDMMNALSNVSVGDPGSIMANVSKFAGSAHANKVDMKTAMAMYASLTNTFTAEEAAVRTNSVMNWAMKANKTTGRLTDIDPKIAAQFDALVYKKGPDGKEYKNDITSIVAGAGKIIDSITDVRKRDEVTSSMGNEVRTGQGLQGVQSSVASGLFGKSLKVMSESEGIAARSIDSFNQSSGAKISMFFNGMESGLQATTGALIDLFSSPEKFDTKSWEEAMGGIGMALKQNLGDGAARPIEMLQRLVSYMASSDGQAFAKNLESSAIKLGETIGAIGSFVIDIATSDTAKSLMGFIAEHPVWAIAIGTVGMDVAKASIQGAVQGAIAAGFGPQLALGAITVASLVVASAVIEDLVAKQRKSEDMGNEEVNKANSEVTRKQIAYDILKKTSPGSAEAQKAERELQISKGYAKIAGFQKEEIDYNGSAGGIVEQILSNIPGVTSKHLDETKAKIAGVQEQINIISKEGRAPFIGPQNVVGKPATGGNMFTESFNNLKSLIGGQDKKVGDGADKMSKAASDWAGPMAMMIQSAAALSSAAAHLGSLQISGTSGGGGGSPTAGNSANRSTWGDIVHALSGGPKK